MSENWGPLLIMEELRQLGFHISLDDFGTGFSSLSYLNALPISEIKIDRSFVSNMLSRSQSESLVKTIVAIGHSNRIIVVAEGVETVDQQIRLHQLGCDRLQGYLFSKPVSLKDLVNVIEASRTASV
ncbi:EAL domain-containing protein [Vibrio vulnificus]|uniref:EAL domain-containing protein n=1 Tax=Vibrio vulnificus TaxID=672 RepID=UPI0034E0690A